MDAAIAPDEERTRMVHAMRRLSKADVPDAERIGPQLREALPRALLAPCDRQLRSMFANPDPAWDFWRGHARKLLTGAWRLTAHGMSTPEWARSLQAQSPLAGLLDESLQRKRTPCHLKLSQVDPTPQLPCLHALSGRAPH